MEGSTFAFGFRQYRRITSGRRIGLLPFIRRSKDPNLFVTLLEDGAALIGLGFAALGVTGALLGSPWADGVASIAIGVLLMSVAFLLADETRSLIAGEAADPFVVASIKEALGSQEAKVSEVATLQLGPDRILVAVTLDVRRGEVEQVTRELTRRVHAADPRVFRVYFRPQEA